jgi:acyl-homoserine lactone synthase
MIVTIKGNETDRHPGLMEQVWRFRHRIFVEELGWSNIARPDGREIDQFDHEDAIHQICLIGEQLVGYQRLLPTTRPHLLTDVMPELCEGPPPVGPHIFEWTRNCVAPEYRDNAMRLSKVSLELHIAVAEWCMAHGVNTVTVQIEPLFLLRALQMHVLVRPLGFQKRVGKKLAIAVSITFDERSLKTLRRAFGSEAPIFGEPPLIQLAA